MLKFRNKVGISQNFVEYISILYRKIYLFTSDIQIPTGYLVPTILMDVSIVGCDIDMSARQRQPTGLPRPQPVRQAEGA